MATRSALAQARKMSAQTLVNQTGGPWTDISFEYNDLKGHSGGTVQISRPTTTDFQVVSAGLYLVKIFLAGDHSAGGTGGSDYVFMTRSIINGVTVPPQSYAYHGDHSAVGRNGHSHAFLVSLAASDIVKFQYRVNINIAALNSVPTTAIGGTVPSNDAMAETGAGTTPAGPAVTTASFERVNEDFANVPLIALRETANTALSVTFVDLVWDAEDLRVVFATSVGSAIVTIPEPGVYAVGYYLAVEQVTSGAGGSADTLYGRCLLNAVDIPQSNAHGGVHITSVGRPFVSHMFCKRFDTGDQLKFQHRISAIDDANPKIGGSTTVFREAVTSMFVMKVSDLGVLEETSLNALIDAATPGQTGLPAGWSETHTSATPVNWHASNIRSSPKQGGNSIRYANQVANNYAGAGTNSGDITTSVFPTVPTGYTTYQLSVDVFAQVETGATFDLYRIEVHSTGLGLLTTILKASLGNGNTGGVWQTFINTISASVAGRSDIFLKIFFNTVDGAANSTEGVYMDNFRLMGLA